MFRGCALRFTGLSRSLRLQASCRLICARRFAAVSGFGSEDGSACSAVEELLQHELQPLLQRRSNVQAHLEPLLRELCNLDGVVSDCEKRLAAAEEQVRARQGDVSSYDEHIGDLLRRLQEKETRRTAKGDEYRYYAKAVGIDEAAADNVLKHICKHPAEPQKGPLLTEFADLHQQCVDIQHQIAGAEACVLKAKAVITEKRSEADDLSLKRQHTNAQKAELEKQVQELQGALDRIADAVARRDLDAQRMRAAVAWAERISPFLRPTTENLPMLLLHRHHAIQSACLSAEDFGLSVLRELACTADEVAEFPNITKRLRACGFSAADLRVMHFPVSQLKSAGYQAGELLKAGFAAAELKDAGFKVGDLALTASELRRAGFSLQELLANGFSVEQLKLAGSTAGELREVGISAVDLISVGFSEEELLDAGVEVDLVSAAFGKSCGLTVAELLHDFSLSQLKRAGFSATDLFPESKLASIRYAMI